MDDSRAERWGRSAQLPLLVASLLFVAAYAWPILDPDLGRERVHLCAVVVWATWVVLALELLARFVIAENRWLFLRKHPLDVLAVLLPVLRPLQMLRLLTVLNVLNRYAGSSLRSRVGAYLGVSISLIVLMGSLAVLDAERGGRGPIQSFGDALWWSLATITSVGYGDVYPTTTEGRLVAVGMMFCGIAVIGVVAASFASWLMERVEEIEEIEEGVTATADDVHALRDEVAQLRASLEARDAL